MEDMIEEKKNVGNVYTVTILGLSPAFISLP
jgi:hypothetical protein